KVDVGAFEQQNAEVKDYCTEAKEAAEMMSTVTKDIDGFQGQPGDSINDYFSTSYPALSKAIMMHAEQYALAHQKYQEEYNSQCDGESRDSEELEQWIQESETLIQQYEQEIHELNQKKSQSGAFGFLAEIGNQRIITTLRIRVAAVEKLKADFQKKLEELLAFDAASSGYFSEAAELLMTKGLQAIGQ